MKRKNQNKRREFLNNVCPTVALAFMGVTVLQACSSGGDDGDVAGGGGGSNNNGGSSNLGYTKSGNNVTINLNHSNFNKLHSDGWFNLFQEKILLLKVSSSSYRAFTGSCPHQGTHTAWSYNGSSGYNPSKKAAFKYKGFSALPTELNPFVLRVLSIKTQ